MLTHAGIEGLLASIPAVVLMTGDEQIGREGRDARGVPPLRRALGVRAQPVARDLRARVAERVPRADYYDKNTGKRIICEERTFILEKEFYDFYNIVLGSSQIRKESTKEGVKFLILTEADKDFLKFKHRWLEREEYLETHFNEEKKIKYLIGNLYDSEEYDSARTSRFENYSNFGVLHDLLGRHVKLEIGKRADFMNYIKDKELEKAKQTKKEKEEKEIMEDGFWGHDIESEKQMAEINFYDDEYSNSNISEEINSEADSEAGGYWPSSPLDDEVVVFAVLPIDIEYINYLNDIEESEA